MMISLARDMASKFDQLKASGRDVTLQFLFLDGEEAFVNWDRKKVTKSHHLRAAFDLINTLNSIRMQFTAPAIWLPNGRANAIQEKTTAKGPPLSLTEWYAWLT